MAEPYIDSVSKNSISKPKEKVNKKYYVTGKAFSQKLAELTDDIKKTYNFVKLQLNAEGDIINNGQQTVTGDDINGSTNPELLGGRTVSTANRGGNSLRQQGENSRKISSFIGVTSDGKGNPNPVYRAGDSGWFVRQAEQKGEIRNRFEEGVRGKISRIATLF